MTKKLCDEDIVMAKPEGIAGIEIKSDVFERDYTRIEQTIKEYKEGKSCSIR